MINNINIHYAFMDKIKNKVHKNIYNKKLWIRQNLINEVAVISSLSVKYVLRDIANLFISRLIKDEKNNI